MMPASKHEKAQGAMKVPRLGFEAGARKRVAWEPVHCVHAGDQLRQCVGTVVNVPLLASGKLLRCPTWMKYLKRIIFSNRWSVLSNTTPA